MKKNTLATIIIGIALIYFIVAIVLTQNAKNVEPIKIVQEIEFDANINKSSGPGFNLDKDKMHFGRLGNHSSSTRKFNLTNSYNKDMQAEFFIAGYNQSLGNNLMIRPSSSEILLQGETKEFSATFYSANLTDGLYEGKIIIEFN